MVTDFPRYVNAVLRAITCRPEILERSVMMSSVMPSEKYSCSGSPLMLLKGNTAIDGRSGAADAGGGTVGVTADEMPAGGTPRATLNTRTGRSMFFRACSPV